MRDADLVRASDDDGMNQRPDHFANKYGPIARLFRQGIEEVLARTDGTWTCYDYQIASIHAFLEHAECYIDVTSNANEYDLFIKTMRLQAHEALAERLLAGGVVPDRRTWFSIGCAVLSSLIATIYWYRDGRHMGPETLGEWITENFPQRAKDALFGPVGSDVAK